MAPLILVGIILILGIFADHRVEGWKNRKFMIEWNSARRHGASISTAPNQHEWREVNEIETRRIQR
ncbi:MAG: hypothetical protein GY859_10285, partial [Desulfobacterales bacterium]|nr:hypothetical protein [Desulfobacterales bacterium]